MSDAAVREWTHMERDEWGVGPWDGEPDKRQWIDPETDLDCLMVRNRMGNWCGYVGVPEGHPWFGIEYSQSINPDCPKCADPDDWCYDCRPEAKIEVHGGLTFSGACQEPTEEEWLRLSERAEEPRLLRKAEKYPEGDAARRLAYLRASTLLTFEEWVEQEMARRICHVPAPGRGEVWWFGFDCGHLNDISPGHDALSRRMGWGSMRDGYASYRELDYVEREVTRLAKQLVEVLP